MKQEILNRIDSLVDNYVNQYRSDWTDIYRPCVEKLNDDQSFLVMMRPSGVDVAFFDGEQMTIGNAFHSQAAVPYHELFLYYDGENAQSVKKDFAQTLCDKAASRFENLDFSMDGFLKAVKRCLDVADRYKEEITSAVGECGPWKVSYSREHSSDLVLEVSHESEVVAKGFHVTRDSTYDLEFGRYHNRISDRTFNEMFNLLRSEFPRLIRNYDERERAINSPYYEESR